MIERRLDAGRHDEARRYMGMVTDAAQRAATLTSRLLAFGRRQSLDVKPINVVEALRAVESILTSTLGENISIEVIAEDDVMLALADLHQLESALLNMGINARDAMPSGGRLELRATRIESTGRPDLAPGSYVQLAVCDTGEGMPPEVVERAFEPFFTTKPVGSGTGLGLSMVYGFVKQVGGHVSINSKTGVGTTISVLLRSAPRLEEALPPPLPSVEEGAGEHVLVVEDDPQVRTVVTDLLADLGYSVRSAKDADEAMALLN